MEREEIQTDTDKRILLRIPKDRWWKLKELAVKLRYENMTQLINDVLEEKLKAAEQG